jgi:hypothetical protein
VLEHRDEAFLSVDANWLAACFGQLSKESEVSLDNGFVGLFHSLSENVHKLAKSVGLDSHFGIFKDLFH